MLITAMPHAEFIHVSDFGSDGMTSKGRARTTVVGENVIPVFIESNKTMWKASRLTARGLVPLEACCARVWMRYVSLTPLVTFAKRSMTVKLTKMVYIVETVARCIRFCRVAAVTWPTERTVSLTSWMA